MAKLPPRDAGVRDDADDVTARAVAGCVAEHAHKLIATVLRD